MTSPFTWTKIVLIALLSKTLGDNSASRDPETPSIEPTGTTPAKVRISVLYVVPAVMAKLLLAY